MKPLHEDALKEIGWRNVWDLCLIPEWQYRERLLKQTPEEWLSYEELSNKTKFDAVYKQCRNEFKDIPPFNLEWIGEEAGKRGD